MSSGDDDVRVMRALTNKITIIIDAAMLQNGWIINHL